MPILVVWFGIGVGPAVLTAFLISFFPIMVNIATGLATLEPELEDVLRVLGAPAPMCSSGGPAAQHALLLRRPEGRHHAGLCGHHGVRDDGLERGIGYLLISAGSSMQMGLAFAGLLVVGAMAMVMYEFFAWLERRLTGWAHRGSQN